MKTSKKTILTPELFIDDHHGRYMGQLAWSRLTDYYRRQAEKQLSPSDIKSLETGPDDELYDEACDNLTGVTFKTETGQKLSIQYAEGGMWVIPACFLRSKQSNEFFGC